MLTLSLVSRPPPQSLHTNHPRSHGLNAPVFETKTSVVSVRQAARRVFLDPSGDAGRQGVRVAHVGMSEVREQEAAPSSRPCLSVAVFASLVAFGGVFVVAAVVFVPFLDILFLFASLAFICLCRPRTSGPYVRGTWNVSCVCSFTRFVLLSSEFSARL